MQTPYQKRLDSIKKLYRCQLVIARGQWDDDEEERTLYWATSDLTADVMTLVGHIATRWDLEVLLDASEIQVWLSASRFISRTHRRKPLSEKCKDSRLKIIGFYELYPLHVGRY
jgi:hypothetical protein